MRTTEALSERKPVDLSVGLVSRWGLAWTSVRRGCHRCSVAFVTSGAGSGREVTGTSSISAEFRFVRWGLQSSYGLVSDLVSFET